MFGFILSILLLLTVEIFSFPAQDEYTETLLEIRRKSTGLPDPKVGEKLAAWKPGQDNPEELGSYFEGDILTPPLLTSTRNGIPYTNYRWPKGVIAYKIVGSFTISQLNLIHDAMNTIQRYTSCIYFRTATASDENYVQITNAPTGCFSTVGRIGGKQTINLQTPSCLKIGTVIHELVHTIGFYHEQSRLDRDTYVTINWNNIKPGKERDFQKRSSITYGQYYDYASVMHYSQKAFSKNGHDTIVPKRAGVILTKRNNLSFADMRKIRAMYKCNGAMSTV